MEQNSDRMYWAVGVLALGAEILVGVKVLFPDISFGIRSSIKTSRQL